MSNVLSRGPAVTLQKSGEGWKAILHADGGRYVAFGATREQARANLQFLIGAKKEKS